MSIDKIFVEFPKTTEYKLSYNFSLTVVSSELKKCN